MVDSTDTVNRNGVDMTSTEARPVTDNTVVSADGTRIAFEQSGRGPAVILISSGLADRADAAKLAKILAENFTVINYDRRGRGKTPASGPVAVEREIEDIAALIEHAGGSAHLFGSSSGAILTLRAAAAGLNVERVVAFEPPFVVERESKFGPGEGFPERIEALLVEGRHSEAVKAFMIEAQNMPKMMVSFMKLARGMWRKLCDMAPSLRYDLAVVGDTQQGNPLKPEPWQRIAAPTLVLTGGKSPDGFHNAAKAVTALAPNAEHRVLPGLNHGAVVMAPKKLAPTVTEFLNS
jgi:pimeloyl-ACP methyl ester carboxylesterase